MSWTEYRDGVKYVNGEAVYDKEPKKGLNLFIAFVFMFTVGVCVGYFLFGV